MGPQEKKTSPTPGFLPRGTSTPVLSPYIPRIVPPITTLTPIAYIPTRRPEHLDRSVETQAILAELDAQTASTKPTNVNLPSPKDDDQEDPDFIELFPDLSFEETPLIPPLPPTPRPVEPAIRSPTPTSRPKSERRPTPEALRQRRKHFRPLTVRSGNSKASQRNLAHPPVFVPTRGKPAPSLPGYEVRDFVPQRQRTQPKPIPTNPRTVKTRVIELQKSSTIQPLMDFNSTKLKKVLKRLHTLH